MCFATVNVRHVFLIFKGTVLTTLSKSVGISYS